MAKTKQRNHNEWFRTVERGGRRTCPNCREKLGPEESIWCWGNYVNAKWRNVRDLCRKCWDQVRAMLLDHAGPCGCTITLVGYQGTRLPWWMNLGCREIPSVTEVELKINEHSLRWAGRCYEIACAIWRDFNMDARPAYGHWTGPVHPFSLFSSGRPFQRHGWLELWDGRILDPTRWVFEQWNPTKSKKCKPYIYVGENDHYDLGGQEFLKSLMPAAPPKQKPGEPRYLFRTVHVGVSAWLPRWFSEQTPSARPDGWFETMLTIPQISWMAHLPLDFLYAHELAHNLYRAIDHAGFWAAIPLDTREAVLGRGAKSERDLHEETRQADRPEESAVLSGSGTA